MNNSLPIAEYFDSIQGEGVYSGVRMFFVRLAGCTVGKSFPKEMYIVLPHCGFKCEGGDPDMGHGPNCAYAKSTHTLPIYTEKCTLYDGREFPCDTDYRSKEKLTCEEVLEKIPKEVSHVCITGGEPFMHKLVPLVTSLQEEGKKVHIETSGTIPLKKAFPQNESNDPHPCELEVWITVSPKFGILDEMIDRADELKILVDKDFDPKKLPQPILTHDCVFLQPVNGEYTIDKENVKRVMKWQGEFPNWRVSLQLHKVLEGIISERVR